MSPDLVHGPNSFAPGVTEKIGFYVYLLIDPRNSAVFYIGKGTGNRCFAHLDEARSTSADTLGDYAKLGRIRENEAAGHPVRIDLLRHGLSEAEALLVESTAIDLLGLLGLTNRVVGHNAAECGRMSVLEINVMYGATPVEIDPVQCVILIRINRLFKRGMSDHELYEATRKWWKIGPAKRRLDALGSPQWAMAVYDGIVRAVYRIEAWERPSDDPAIDPKYVSRWGFRGTRDPDMEKLYLHHDVSRYLRSTDTGSPSQNPIHYVNCTLSRQAFIG